MISNDAFWGGIIGGLIPTIITIITAIIAYKQLHAPYKTYLQLDIKDEGFEGKIVLRNSGTSLAKNVKLKFNIFEGIAPLPHPIKKELKKGIVL